MLRSWSARLAERAEVAGVTVLTDTCGVEVLTGEADFVTGVRTGDNGLGHDGKPMANHQAGYGLLAQGRSHPAS